MGEDDRDGSGSRIRRIAYEYDKNGNRTKRSEYSTDTDTTAGYIAGEESVYNLKNQLTSMTHYGPSKYTSSTETFSLTGGGMDAQGNLTRPSGTLSGTSGYTLSYFPTGQVKQITGTSYNESSEYDAGGRLNLREGLHIGYDGGQPLTEGGGALQDTIVEWGRGPLFSLRINNSYDGTNTSSVPHFVFTDPMGNAALTVDGWGTPENSFTSDIAGTHAENSTWTSTGTSWVWVVDTAVSESGYGMADTYRNLATPKVAQSADGGVMDGGTATVLRFIRRSDYTCYRVSPAGTIRYWGTGVVITLLQSDVCYRSVCPKN